MSINLSQTKSKIVKASSPEEPRRPKRDPVLIVAAVFGLFFFVYSFLQLNFQFSLLMEGTVKFITSFTKMFPPNVSDWRAILDAAVVTLQVAILGTVLAIIAAFVLAFFAAENVSPRTAYWVKGFVSFLRAVPTLIWALIFIVAVGLGPFPAILAIGVHAVGMLTKMFAQSIEEVDEGVLEAMRATGASWVQIMAQGVLPCVLSSFLAWSVFRLEIDIGESVILGAVGAGGIGWEISNAMRSYEFETVGFVALIIFFMVFSVEWISNRLKLRMRKGT